MKKKISNYLKELNFNNNEIKVYLSLAELGEARASQVAKLADVPRTTAISVLDKLYQKGFLTTHIYKGVKTYWIESPHALLDSLNGKVEIAKKLSEALPNIYHARGSFPFAKIFDTKSGIKNAIKNILNGLEKGDVIYTIDTLAEGNYDKIFSKDIGNEFFNIKKKKGITTKTLIPFDLHSTIPKHKLEAQRIMIKFLPEGVDFKGSLWIIKDKFFNFSGNPPFLVVVKHEVLVQGMKGIYDYLWEISEDIDWKKKI